MSEAITAVVARMHNYGYNMFVDLRDREEGQTLTEYALIIAVIALAVIAAMVLLRNQIRDLFGKAGSELQSQPQS